jgi:hypothetical protein
MAYRILRTSQVSTQVNDGEDPLERNSLGANSEK